MPIAEVSPVSTNKEIMLLGKGPDLPYCCAQPLSSSGVSNSNITTFATVIFISPLHSHKLNCSTYNSMGQLIDDGSGAPIKVSIELNAIGSNYP
jgi:hypothetical protein